MPTTRWGQDDARVRTTGCLGPVPIRLIPTCGNNDPLAAQPRHGGRRPAIHDFRCCSAGKSWMPAFAGMTRRRVPESQSSRRLVLHTTEEMNGHAIAANRPNWALRSTCRGIIRRIGVPTGTIRQRRGWGARSTGWGYGQDRGAAAPWPQTVPGMWTRAGTNGSVG